MSLTFLVLTVLPSASDKERLPRASAYKGRNRCHVRWVTCGVSTVYKTEPLSGVLCTLTASYPRCMVHVTVAHALACRRLLYKSLLHSPTPLLAGDRSMLLLHSPSQLIAGDRCKGFKSFNPRSCLQARKRVLNSLFPSISKGAPEDFWASAVLILIRCFPSFMREVINRDRMSSGTFLQKFFYKNFYAIIFFISGE